MTEQRTPPSAKEQRVTFIVTVPIITRDEAMVLWTKLTNVLEPYDNVEVKANIEEPRLRPPFAQI